MTGVAEAASCDSRHRIFIAADTAGDLSMAELQALEGELNFQWPNGFREFLAAHGAGSICGVEILGPVQIRARTEQLGRKMRAYGLKRMPESLASAALNKSVIVAGTQLFCNPVAPGILYWLREDAIEEVGGSFAEFADWVRQQGGEQVRKLHFTPREVAGRRTKVLISPRRQHCFEAVEMMLTPKDAADGEMLAYDAEAGTFLLGLNGIRGTVACSCQDDLHRIVLDYAEEAESDSLAAVLATVAKLGYQEAGGATEERAVEPGAVDGTMHNAAYPDERILAVLPDYALEKRVSGDLVFTNRRLFFFYREGRVEDAVESSLDDLLALRGRYEAYLYNDLKRLLLKRNLFGRSLVAVTPQRSGKNEYYGPKRLLATALAIAPELRELGVPLHTVT